VVVGVAGEYLQQHDAVGSHFYNPGYRRVGTLVSDEQVGARFYPNPFGCVLDAGVGEPIGIDPWKSNHISQAELPVTVTVLPPTRKLSVRGLVPLGPEFLEGPRSRAPDRLVIKAVLATPDHDDGVFGRVLAAHPQERCQVPKALKT